MHFNDLLLLKPAIGQALEFQRIFGDLDPVQVRRGALLTLAERSHVQLELVEGTRVPLFLQNIRANFVYICVFGVFHALDSRTWLECDSGIHSCMLEAKTY